MLPNGSVSSSFCCGEGTVELISGRTARWP